MLTPDDAEIVRRDRTMPGLGILLDPEAFAELLKASLRVSHIALAEGYARYKPGISCLVSYEVSFNGQKVRVYARSYRPADGEKIARIMRMPEARGPLGPGRVLVRGASIILSVFPNDVRLPVLRRMTSEAGRQDLLRRLLPRRDDLWSSPTALLRYKPERRFVVGLGEGASMRAVLKFYDASSFAPQKTAHFHSGDISRIAQPLAASKRHRMLAFEWLPGRRLREEFQDGRATADDVARVGAALAELHAHPVRPGGLPQLDAETLARRCLAMAHFVGFIHPSSAGRAAVLARRIAERLRTGGYECRPIHGDFYDTQVLLSGDKVSILDLDEAVLGDPAADLGNFLAHRCAHRVLRSTLPADVIQEALLSGYQERAGAIDSARVALHTAITLLRISPHGFRGREPNWPTRIESLLQQVETVLGVAEDSVSSARSHSGGLASTNGRTTSAPRPASPTIFGDNGHCPVPVNDPFEISRDVALWPACFALNPEEAQRRFQEMAPEVCGSGRLKAIHVVRHRPGRRCIIHYEWIDDKGRSFGLIGKMRAKGPDHHTFLLARALRAAGFADDAPDGIVVPEPLGVIPDWCMWVQRQVAGQPAADLLMRAGGSALARRIAEAIHRLHRSDALKRAGDLAPRQHTLADELAILADRLGQVAQQRPAWEERLKRLLEDCERLAAEMADPRPCTIHRDFYPNQVLADGERVYLLDLDLCSQGDPAVDIGNFRAHLIEQALRQSGDAELFRDADDAFTERYRMLAPDVSESSIEAYTTLSLARHIFISTQFADRHHTTEMLLELCEARLAREALTCQAVVPRQARCCAASQP